MLTLQGDLQEAVRPQSCLTLEVLTANDADLGGALTRVFGTCRDLSFCMLLPTCRGLSGRLSGDFWPGVRRRGSKTRL